MATQAPAVNPIPASSTIVGLRRSSNLGLSSHLIAWTGKTRRRGETFLGFFDRRVGRLGASVQPNNATAALTAGRGEVGFAGDRNASGGRHHDRDRRRAVGRGAG